MCSPPTPVNSSKVLFTETSLIAVLVLCRTTTQQPFRESKKDDPVGTLDHSTALVSLLSPTSPEH
jgi:hypothetical protein